VLVLQQDPVFSPFKIDSILGRLIPNLLLDFKGFLSIIKFYIKSYPIERDPLDGLRLEPHNKANTLQSVIKISKSALLVVHSWHKETRDRGKLRGRRHFEGLRLWFG